MQVSPLHVYYQNILLLGFYLLTFLMQNEPIKNFTPQYKMLRYPNLSDFRELLNKKQ